MRMGRRGIMGLGLAAGTAGLMEQGGRPAMAAAPLQGAQAPGFYRIRVGKIEVTLVNDGAATRPLAAEPMKARSNRVA